MADAIHGNTELGATKMDLILEAVQRELKFRAKLLPTVTDVSAFAEEGLNQISFPKLGSFSVVNRTEGSAGDATTVSSTLDTMDLDQNAYIAWIVDKKTRIQNRIRTEVELARRAGSAHGRYVDERIIATLEGGASLNVNGAVGADVTKDNVLDMIEHLEGNEAILDDSVFLVSADQRKALLKISDFSANDVFGRPVNFTGEIGQLYGIPVMTHTGLSSQQVLLYEKASCAIGFQSAPQMDSQKANEYGVGAMRTALDQLFGTMATQQGEQGAGASESPLIAKLKD